MPAETFGTLSSAAISTCRIACRNYFLPFFGFVFRAADRIAYRKKRKKEKKNLHRKNETELLVLSVINYLTVEKHKIKLLYTVIIFKQYFFLTS